MIKLITAPASEPVTVAALKENEFLRSVDLDYAPNIAFVTAMITTARQLVESYMDRSILPTTWEMSFYDDSDMVLYKGNISSITSVKSVEDDGSETALTDYSYTTGDCARVWFDSSVSLSSRPTDRIRVRYVAGWANANSVPEAIKTAICITVASLWENRQGLPVMAENLILPYRMFQ